MFLMQARRGRRGAVSGPPQGRCCRRRAQAAPRPAPPLSLKLGLRLADRKYIITREEYGEWPKWRNCFISKFCTN